MPIAEAFLSDSTNAQWKGRILDMERIGRANVGGGLASACAWVLSVVLGDFLPESARGGLAVAAFAGVLFFGIRGVWDWAGRPPGSLPRFLLLSVSAIAALLFVAFTFHVSEVVMAGGEAEAPSSPQDKPSGPPALNAFWRGDSVVGSTVFFRIIACAPDDVEVVSKILIPTDLQKQEPLDDQPKAGCEVVYAASKTARQPPLVIFVAAYQRRGAPDTLRTAAFFFDVGPGTQLDHNNPPSHRDETPGNRVGAYREREIDLAFAVPVNSMSLTLPEMYGGGPLQMTAASHGKAFVFDPITRIVAFCAAQDAKVSSLSADLDLQNAAGHDITASWDNRRQTIGLKVDGKVVHPTAGRFADDQCKRTIRPPVEGHGVGPST